MENERELRIKWIDVKSPEERMPSMSAGKSS
jgi:hypothetical protein